MKKLVLVALSVMTLVLGAARSARSQGLLDFKPNPGSTKVSPANPTPRFAAQETTSPRQRLPKASAITFTPTPNASPIEPPPAVVRRDRLVSVAPDELFEGGSESLVAKAVGSAEGTRTPDGGKTWAYYGHVDPGNGVWNRGSFSYQHEARSPEDADERQLNRLRRQFEAIRQTAASNGLRLGLEEQLNGIDLANQAPLAALERGGYVDRLRQAYAQGLQGSEAVLHARTYSFINPNTNQWDAPGLGNNIYSISQDQARRQTAISQAIGVHQRSRSLQTPAKTAAESKPKKSAEQDKSLRAQGGNESQE